MRLLGLKKSAPKGAHKLAAPVMFAFVMAFWTFAFMVMFKTVVTLRTFMPVFVTITVTCWAFMRKFMTALRTLFEVLLTAITVNIDSQSLILLYYLYYIICLLYKEGSFKFIGKLCNSAYSLKSRSIYV